MSEVSYREIGPEEVSQRLDNYLMRILKGVPKSHIYRIIRGGEVRVNKKRAQVSQKLQLGDVIRIPPIRTSTAPVVFVGDNVTAKLQESILFEDEGLLVLNKPAGLAVHGGSGLNLGIIEALRRIRDDLSYLELVHRLDKDTSGCLLIAKKRSVLRAIQALLTTRQVQKTYWALLTYPWTDKKQVQVKAALKKNILKSGERFVSIQEEGKPSETTFLLLENFKQACLVEARPKTGRTHQIRVHSAHLGHVIVGDRKYGSLAGEVEGIDNQSRDLYLHARSISFELQGVKRTFQAEIDPIFANTLKKLRARSLGFNE